MRLLEADAHHATVQIQNAWMNGRRKLLDETTTTTVTERDGVPLYRNWSHISVAASEALAPALGDSLGRTAG